MVEARTAAAGRRWMWAVLWPAFTLLVVVILFVLLRACGLVLPGYGGWHRIGWAFCSNPPRPTESDRTHEHGRALAEQALQLQLQIARKEMACLAAPPAPASPEPRRVERPSCPPIQPARLMLIFDTSGSMRLPLDADPAEMEELEKRWAEGDAQAARRARALQEAPGRKRLHAAREAALALVGRLPPGLETGMVSFDGCRIRTDVPPTVDKGAVTGALNRVAFDGGTPLALALREMQAAMAGGADGGRGRSVVVITDGHEACEGDPCAEARELHRLLPELRVHVIDIVGRSKLQCVAEATRGTIATATDTAALEAAIDKARAELDRSADCVPR